MTEALKICFMSSVFAFVDVVAADDDRRLLSPSPFAWPPGWRLESLAGVGGGDGFLRAEDWLSRQRSCAFGSRARLLCHAEICVCEDCPSIVGLPVVDLGLFAMAQGISVAWEKGSAAAYVAPDCH